MHDIADGDSRSEKQPSHSAKEENGNSHQLSLPGINGGLEIGSEAKVEGGNHDEEKGPEYLFPSSLKDSSKDKNASNRAEQTDNDIQQRHNEPTNELAARS